MNKKRKPLSSVAAPPETNEETIDKILEEVGGGEGAAEKNPQKVSTPQKTEPMLKAAPKKAPELQAPLGQKIKASLYNEMRVYVAKRKIEERGYSIKTFLEEAIADKLAREALKK